MDETRISRGGCTLLREMATVKEVLDLQDLPVQCSDGLVFSHRLIIAAMSPTVAASLVGLDEPCLVLPDNSSSQLKQVISRLFTQQNFAQEMSDDLFDKFHWVDFSRNRTWSITGITNKKESWPRFYTKDGQNTVHSNLLETNTDFSEEFSQFAAAAVNLNNFLSEMESSSHVMESSELASISVEGSLSESVSKCSESSAANPATLRRNGSSPITEGSSSDVLMSSSLSQITSNMTEMTDSVTDMSSKNSKPCDDDMTEVTVVQSAMPVKKNVTKPIVKTIPMDIELENFTLPSAGVSSSSVLLEPKTASSRDKNIIGNVKWRDGPTDSLDLADFGINMFGGKSDGDDFDDLGTYIALGSDGKTGKCKVCYKSFPSISSVRLHVTMFHLAQRGHKDSKNNTQCSICGKILYDKHSLRKHEDAVHLKIRPHTCEICSKKFSIKNDLKDHIQAVHAKVKACMCDICGLPLATRHGLRMHRLIHQDNTKNISCDRCHKSFRHMSTFRKHIARVHEFNPSKRLRCQQCGKLYNHEEGLQRHIRKFHGPADNFSCDLCTATFAYNYDLNKHKKRFHKDYSAIENSSKNQSDIENNQSEVVLKEQKRIPIPRLPGPSNRANVPTTAFNIQYNSPLQHQLSEQNQENKATKKLPDISDHSNHIMKVELPTGEGQLVKDTIYIVKDISTGQNIAVREQLHPVEVEQLAVSNSLAAEEDTQQNMQTILGQ